MSYYFILYCRTCGATIALEKKQQSWTSLAEIGRDVACCIETNLEWNGNDGDVELPDNEEIPEPVFPRKNRIELVLEDMNKTPQGVEQDTTRS